MFNQIVLGFLINPLRDMLGAKLLILMPLQNSVLSLRPTEQLYWPLLEKAPYEIGQIGPICGFIC
jgi:hypothetical protein